MENQNLGWINFFARRHRMTYNKENTKTQLKYRFSCGGHNVLLDDLLSIQQASVLICIIILEK